MSESDTPRTDTEALTQFGIEEVPAGFARNLERELAEAKEDERWLREMLADYRISFDDHAVGRRMALNQFIHDLRSELAETRKALEEMRGQCDAPRSALEKCAEYLASAHLELLSIDDVKDGMPLVSTSLTVNIAAVLALANRTLSKD